MSNISNATIAMNETVASFPDNVFLDIPAVGNLLVDSVGVLNAVNEGTTVAQNSANLTVLEAVGFSLFFPFCFRCVCELWLGGEERVEWWWC